MPTSTLWLSSALVAGALLIAQVSQAAEVQDVTPVEVDETKLSPGQADGWRAAQDLNGYATVRKAFEFEFTDVGHWRGFPESLFVRLRTTTSGLINSVWWWNPLDGDGNPTYDWNAFLKVHKKASEVLGRHVWLKTWRDAGPGRLIELHAFGTAIGVDNLEMNCCVMPLWREAALNGEPTYHVLLRRGDTGWAALYFGAEETRALVESVEEPDEAPAHWVDGLHVHFHPRCTPGEESSRYVIVEPEGDWAVRTVGSCEP